MKISLAKATGNVTIDAEVWEKSKREFNSVSQEIEDLLKRKLEISEYNKINSLKQREEEIQDEIKDLNESEEKIKNEKKEKTNELKAVRGKIEKLKKKKEDNKKSLERFKEVFRKKEKDGWNKPEDINQYWSKELDKTKEQLWEIGKDLG